MKRFIALVAVCGWALLCLSATAQTTPSDKPGYLDFKAMSLVPANIEPQVEVNLTEPLIRLAMSTALGMTDEMGKNPDRLPPDAKVLFDSVDNLLKKMNLSLLQVRVFELEDEQAEGTVGRVKDATRGMMDKGWMPVVRVGEDDESVNIMMRSDDKNILGLTAMIADGGDLVFANLVGEIDPAQLGTSIGSIAGKLAGGEINMQQMEGFIQGMMQGVNQANNTGSHDHGEASHEAHGESSSGHSEMQ